MPELLFVPPLAGARTNELIAEHMRTRGVFLVYIREIKLDVMSNSKR